MAFDKVVTRNYESTTVNHFKIFASQCFFDLLLSKHSDEETGMAEPVVKELSAPYVVLLDKDGDRRFTFHETEDDVCAFVLSLFEQHRVQEVTEENARSAASRKGAGGVSNLPPPELIQYTANDVLDFLDLNVSDVQVLIRVRRELVPATGGGSKTQRPLLEAHDTEWVKSAVCRYLVRCLPQEDDDDDDAGTNASGNR
jgi:hypothetical protein